MQDQQPQDAAYKWKCGAVKAIQAGEYEKAITALSHALSKEPDNDLLYFSRAIAFSKMKDHKKTKEDLEKAASLGNEKARYYLTQFN